MRAKTCCVTGHMGITAEKLEYVKGKLQREILQAITDGYTHFISGFTEDVDLLFATIVADLITKNPVLTLETALPYRNRMKTTDELFQRLLGKCSIIGIHSEAYSPSCFMKCNHFMVSVSQRIIVVYDGHEKGEAFSTMRYAYSQERDVRVITI